MYIYLITIRVKFRVYPGIRPGLPIARAEVQEGCTSHITFGISTIQISKKCYARHNGLLSELAHDGLLTVG